MNEPGAAASNALTNWFLMDVTSMWVCLKNQDTTNHWRHVTGWRKVCELAQDHLEKLQAYRRGLAEAWPPETNSAARAYLRELDKLVDQVRQTHDAAAANLAALDAATKAIGSSRDTLRQIHDEYEAKLQQKRSYEAAIADPKVIVGGRTSFTEPPVTEADLERLNGRARGIMFGLSSELQQAQIALRPPPSTPPKRPPGTEPTDASSPAPIIPPIVPVPLTPSSPTPHSAAAPKAAPAAAKLRVGPILGTTGTAPGPAPSSPPVHPGTDTAGPPRSPGLPPPHNPGRPGGQSGGPGAGPPRHATSRGATSPPPASQPPTSRRFPSGGVIGGAPHAGPRQPGSTDGHPRRPVGGVIGGGGAGTAPTGGAGSRPGGGRGLPGGPTIPALGVAPGAPVGRSGGPARRNSEDVPRAWNPDHPWETDQGVDPVIQPPKGEGPIDPGPAIGFTK
ncbi:hypothetical protein [Salinispora arenicola]|uniref:hypothetical protein n=1 Tax=Salinispora arenicola TaxID=168697 RepID=UPI0027DD4536|nr:hypothetical protein [Salinispora arenicola]